MLVRRIVPCLDIKDGRTVKGVNFVNIRDAGDPVELGASYEFSVYHIVDAQDPYHLFPIEHVQVKGQP